MRMCDGQHHVLIDIVEYDVNQMYSKVVRWCEFCGAIVIDVDIDGRTSAGHEMKMRFPTWIKKLHESRKTS